jgi:hypothetical protein
MLTTSTACLSQHAPLSIHQSTHQEPSSSNNAWKCMSVGAPTGNQFSLCRYVIGIMTRTHLQRLDDSSVVYRRVWLTTRKQVAGIWDALSKKSTIFYVHCSRCDLEERQMPVP